VNCSNRDGTDALQLTAVVLDPELQMQSINRLTMRLSQAQVATNKLRAAAINFVLHGSPAANVKRCSQHSFLRALSSVYCNEQMATRWC